MSRRVVLVIGPPASGKTTLGTELARANRAELFDSDDSRWTSDESFLYGVRRETVKPDANAVVLRTGSTALARRRILWLAQPTAIVVMGTTRDECLARLRGREQNKHSAIRAIDKWFNNPPTDEERAAWGVPFTEV